MKKILSLVLSVAMMLSLCAMLFACDQTADNGGKESTASTETSTEAVTEGETAVAHTCEFDTEAWAKNETAHWHACKTENCTVKQDETEHAFTSPVIEQTDSKITRTYTCEVCAYEKVEETTINSIVNNEATWDQAFENLSFVNYSIVITLKQPEGTHINRVEVGENAAHYDVAYLVEFYTEKGQDGAYTTYFRYDDEDETFDGFVKLSDNTSDEYYKAAATEALLQISFAESFEKFSYDAEKGAYVCADEIVAIMFYADGTPVEEKMTCFNCMVKVADGKITHIEAEYYLGDEKDADYEYSFCYYNIGMTEVIVPQSVKDTTVEKTEDELGFGVSSGPEEDVQENMPEQDQMAGAPDQGVGEGGIVTNPDGTVSSDGNASGGVVGNEGVAEAETAYAEPGYPGDAEMDAPTA